MFEAVTMLAKMLAALSVEGASDNLFVGWCLVRMRAIMLDSL